MDETFGLESYTGMYKPAAEESKALLNETGDWESDAYGVDGSAGGADDDDWNDLFMGMDVANDAVSHPLIDQPTSGSFVSSFNRSASAPDLMGMPGVAVPPWYQLPANSLAPVGPYATERKPAMKRSVPAKQKTVLERSASTPSLVNIQPARSTFALPVNQSASMGRSASASTLVGLEAHIMRPTVPSKAHPKRVPLTYKSSDDESSSASPRDKPTKRTVARTPEERKQRRLETNRAAAKRAYYRRQGKMDETKTDNDRLRKLTALQADRIRVYEAVLREAGYDPDAVVKQFPAVAMRGGELRAANQNSQGDGIKLGTEKTPGDGSSRPTAKATHTCHGRPVRPTKC